LTEYLEREYVCRIFKLDELISFPFDTQIKLTTFRECFNFMTSKVGILKDDLSTKDTLNILSGITRYTIYKECTVFIQFLSHRSKKEVYTELNLLTLMSDILGCARYFLDS